MQSANYLLPDTWDMSEFESRLKGSFKLAVDAPRRLTQTCLDSFDWRIWQAGAYLVYEQNAKTSRLCWVDLAQGNGQCMQVDRPPVFPADLPAGALCDRIGNAMAMRVLIPMVQVEQQLQIFRLLDGEEKTVLRIILQSNRFSSPDGKQQGDLSDLVQLQSLKGYDKRFKKMQAKLEKMGLQPFKESLLGHALKGIGRKQGDYSSKLNYHLDPKARGDATVKQIMLGLLNTLEKNISGTKAKLDSEFLHDLRVATRRTRSAMSQIKNVFNPEELERFKKDFAWLGQVTGSARDMDVYLLKFAAYQKSLPVQIQPDLTPFHDFIVANHKQAYKALVRKLNSARFLTLIKDWRQWLEAPIPNVAIQPNAVRPINELANHRIFKVYNRVLKDGGAIKPDSAPERLHDLRKDCKKLRYLMEFFQSLYPDSEICNLIRQLKILLDNLGDFQDLQVQAETIESFGEQMQGEGAPSNTLMSMGILVGNLLTRQEQARAQFADLFASFSSAKNAKLFKNLFRS